MSDWQVYADKSRELLNLKNLADAKEEVEAGLEKIPNQVNLLTIANDICRASGDRENSLKYSELLISHHPGNIDGYRRVTEDLIAIDRITDAEKFAEEILQRFPNSLEALEVAIEVFRKTSNSVRLLECKEKLIHFHPCIKEIVESSLRRLSDGVEDLHQIRYLISPETPIIKGRTGSFCNELIQCDPAITKQRLWIRSFHTKSVTTGYRKDFADYQPFQYWSQGTPPHDVQALTLIWNRLFNDLGIRPIRVFDKRDALDFISEYTPELLPAFESAFHYTIESDIFRIAFALFNDCIYTDADCFPKKETRDLMQTLLAEQTTSLCFRWFRVWICSGFFATCAQSPFFKRIVDEMNGYSFIGKPRTRKEVFDSFGPARYNATLADFMDDNSGINTSDGASEIVIDEGWHIKFANCHNAFSEGHFSLEYKKTNDNWWQQFSV